MTSDLSVFMGVIGIFMGIAGIAIFYFADEIVKILPGKVKKT
jgi:hypothetical protein